MAGQLWKYDSIRGLYHMEDTSDSSPNGNDLTVTGAVIAPAKIVNGYSFTTDDYLKADGLLASCANDTKGTMAFWFYVDSESGNVETALTMTKGTGVAHSSFGVRAWTAGTSNYLDVIILVDDVIQWRVRSPTDSISFGAWNCIIIKHDGTELSEIKINNVSQAVFSIVGTNKIPWLKAIITDAATPVDTVTFGALQQDGIFVQHLDGDLDEFVIVGDMWDADDDTDFWNGGAGRAITDPSRQRFIGKRPELTVDKQIIGNRGNPIIR